MTATLTFPKPASYNQHARFKLREKEQMLVIAQSMGQNVMATSAVCSFSRLLPDVLAGVACRLDYAA